MMDKHNIVTAFVNAQFIAIIEFLGDCKIKKIWTVPSATLWLHT